MKYNLTQYSQTISNTAEGDIDLSTSEIISIINSSIASVDIPVSGTSSGTLVLDSDLGARIHVDEVQYYFDTINSPATVASGIKFYYKNEDFEVYTSLNTYYNGSYYYTTVSGSDAPRYIRVEHTVVSGVSGKLNGFYVLNDDTYVDFGTDGNRVNHNVNLSLENAIVEINEMEVFNSGPVTANAKLIIEPQYTAVDDILYISPTSDGPWQGVFSDEDKITGSDVWESGTIYDLQVSSNILKLLSGKTLGTYTTRILDLDEYQNLTFLAMNHNYPVVYPTVEFIDDFTYGNDYGYWTEITNSQYIYFRNGRLEMQNDNTRVRTTETLEYTDDWFFTCRFYVGGVGSNGSNLRIYINDTSGAYVYFGFDTAYSTVSDMYIRLVTAAGTKYQLSAHEAQDYVGTWTWLKVQKNFNTLRFKYWNYGDSEPDWVGSYTIPLSEIATTGKIDIRLIDDVYNKLMYIDDVTLTKNYTATPSESSFISVDVGDSTETVEVRSSNSKPMNRETFIRTTGSYGSATKYTNHYFIADGSSDEQSSDWGTWGQTSNYWEYWYDSVRDDEYIVDKPFYTAGNTSVFFRIRRKDGTLYSATISNTTYGNDCFYSTYKLVPDQSGGFWINFFLARGNSNTGIYYLRYYNATLGVVYDRQATVDQGTFLYDMDAAYEASGNLWYVDPQLATVFKINTDGTILASYLATEGTRGILALADGGCWFIQDQDLVRLDYNAQVVDRLTLPTVNASYIYSDLYGGFYLHAGDTVYHLSANGTEYFNVTIEGLYHISVIDSGFITKQHDGSTTTPPQASYVSKDYRGVVRTWNYPQNEGGYEGTFDYNRYGVRSHTFDDTVDDHSSHFPISIDEQWNNSTEWIPVAVRDYNFTNEKYHQIRFTLRADNSANSPEVYGLWTQRAIEVPNIYPGNYERFYLKSDVTYLAAQDAGNYTSKIRAYWLLNTE